MPQTGMRRVSLALASAALITMGGLSGVGIAHAASDAPNHVASHAARDATSYLSLNILPDDGENAIYNFINSATSSVNVTIYELNDVTMENDLVAREKAGATVRVILDQAQKSYNTAAYNLLTAGGVGVVWSSTAFTYTHQKTITVNNDESYVSTGNFDNTYYATSRDFGVFDTDPTDVAAIVAVFNDDYKHTTITPSDGDDLVWSPTDSQTQLLALINGAQHTLDVEQEEFEDSTLVNAIVADENRGVTVRVVVEDPSEYTSYLDEVTGAGGTVNSYSSTTGFYIHAKTVIADYGYSTAKAFVGSENFSSGSLNDNRELGIITTNSSIISGLETSFDGDFTGSDNNKVSIFSPGTQTTAVGGTVYYQTQGEDTCTGTLSYKATGLPTGLSINSTTGVISGTASTAGTYTVTLTGTDTTGPTGSATFTWDVGTTSNTVTVTNPGSQTGTVGTAASLQVSASDSASGQTLTYSATGLPAALSISASTGLITGTPTTAGSNSVTVTVKDTTGATGSASFTWTINSSTSGNTVTVTNPGSQSGTVGTAASLQVSASDSASGQTLTYSATGLPAGLSISASTGLITGTPTTAGSNSVTVTVKDTTGATGSASFTWTISAASGCGSQQLIQNGGFATGSISPWTASSGVLTAKSSSHPSYPSTDPYLAWIDGYSGKHTDTLAQTVTIPATCKTATLSFWLYIDSTDPTSKAYDTFTTQVLNSSGTVLATLGTLSNQNESSGYVEYSYSMSSYIGQTVTIEFTGVETYTSGDTSFYEDDNALNAS
jgi:phosphatidylserine/phosphatidylglycerophosphate/cardiolipin synthase-like enzyme